MRPGRQEGPETEVEGADARSEEEKAKQEKQEKQDEREARQEREDRWEHGHHDKDREDRGSAPPSESPQQAAVVPSPLRPAGQSVEHTAAEPVLQILPLGSGLVLIGLGLGLAFVALRVRRS